MGHVNRTRLSTEIQSPGRTARRYPRTDRYSSSLPLVSICELFYTDFYYVRKRGLAKTLFYTQ